MLKLLLESKESNFENKLSSFLFISFKAEKAFPLTTNKALPVGIKLFLALPGAIGIREPIQVKIKKEVGMNLRLCEGEVEDTF